MNQRHRIETTVEPSVEPVSTSEAKAHLRIDGSAEDTYIESLIKAARIMVENQTNRRLITQTVKLFLDDWPKSSKSKDYERDGYFQMAISQVLSRRDYIEMPVGPVQSISAFTTYDEADNAYTFAAGNYNLSKSYTPARVVLSNGTAWPDTDLRSADGIELTLVLGYGDAGSDVPQDLRQAVLMLAAHMYENRGDCDPASLPQSINAILSRYKVFKL